ncbi:hypothetical protein K254310026_18620 [Clostridium tetani]|nr:hypothetical protein K254310026_18620 [Clostridium tetani]
MKNPWTSPGLIHLEHAFKASTRLGGKVIYIKNILFIWVNVVYYNYISKIMT